MQSRFLGIDPKRPHFYNDYGGDPSMAEPKFTDYSQIAEMPVRSQQDYLMKYIAGRSLNQNYAYFRCKMPPKEDGSKYTSAGLTTREEQQKANDKTCSDINSRKWSDSNDSELRRLRKHIELFFQGLGIDTNLFKKGRQYQMTDELIEFFDFILDNDEGITSQIIGRKFSNVSNRIYHYIYSCLLAALRTAPCSEEEKELSKERFLTLMNENEVDLAFQSENKIVDAILRITWEKIMEKGWKPNPSKFQHEYDDFEWAVVTERVCKELLERGFLVPKPDGLGNERPHLVSDCDIPIQLFFR